ncbi:Glutamyl aminopeptidase-like Protein [Tribolium castaneum]|uniref:Aminopeptidase n=1 Tax=Tribolium castaneum TaxID=7070 RepID=D7EJC6_TRICA|nr:Glutamyl aminopeptidase-like Protein [Tribolium castaneum]
MTSESRSEKPKRKSRKTFAVLLSCCLFLAIVCASLLAALVLIGKHIVYNSAPRNVVKVPKIVPKYVHSRLPRNTFPISYDVVLKPDLETGTFTGTVNITVNVTAVRNDLIVNSKNLNIEAVHLMRDWKSVEIDNVEENVVDEVLIVESEEILYPGIYNLYFKYNGSMLNKMVGLYRSRRIDNNTGLTRNMATSKFEPTYARQAFPCFDEPNLKAKYKVHLLKPNDPEYIALSNNPQDSEEIVPEGVMVHFNETVPMSTYLSCFIVSDFKYTNTTFQNGGQDIPFRVYASPHQLEKTTYAGEVGKKVIEYYITYFAIPYPLPKLDMVAIPDFVSGAMEHWGLVTYRETALLYNNKTHSASNKQRVAEVVAHELAHSWFGNLVTMDWWNNLWLNEGFATYIAAKGIHAITPEWQMMDQFLINTLHSILSLDATQGSHPIIQTVETPDQITEVFDSVSYNKGASVLRMLETVVTPATFQKGVTNYLKKHEYGNAVTQDLWDEIQAVVGDTLNVTEFMNTVMIADYDPARTQKSSPLNYKWSVPVKFITDLGESDKIYWFNYKSDRLVIDKPANAKWIKFNPSQIGYYRVNYAENDWKTLTENIESLSIADRTHLLEESFSIAQSGDLSYEIPLTMTKYLTKETNYIPWGVASSQLQQIAKYLQNSRLDSGFKNYVVTLLKPAYDNLTWDDSDDSEGHLEKLARVVILNLACVMDYDEALNEAKSIFGQWIDDNSFEISPNLRSIVYKFGMVTADEVTWNKVFEIFANETDANEKLKLMNGLANVRNPSLLTKLIDLAKDETYVRSQDYFTLLQYISSNPVGTPIVWDYVRENWPYLVERFTLNDRYLGRLIPAITNRFSTNLKVDEMKSFFAKYPEAGAGAAARQQALETVANNIKWLEKYKTVVENWITV